MTASAYHVFEPAVVVLPPLRSHGLVRNQMRSFSNHSHFSKIVRVLRIFYVT